MCGFLGNCSFNDKISITTLRSATKSLEKRGPDANGEFINKQIRTLKSFSCFNEFKFNFFVEKIRLFKNNF